MTREQELVQLFGDRSRELEALRGVCGGVSATHLRTACLSERAYEAALEVWGVKTRSGLRPAR